MTSKQSERGFTMAELLVVVAIIAVLVAIAIPVFGAQLEKSRQAVDLANTRSAYAALQMAKIEGTLPDGSAHAEGSSKPYYVYTSNGFEASGSIQDKPIRLISSSAPSLLSEFITLPSPETNHLPEQKTLKDCALLVRCFGTDLKEMELTLVPADWYK